LRIPDKPVGRRTKYYLFSVRGITNQNEGTMKELKFNLNGKTISAGLASKVDKKSLYGYAKRIVEKDGRPLARGILRPDGHLLRRDELTTAYVDPQGTPVEAVVTEIDGKPAQLQPSSFDQESPLTPVSLTTLVGFNVTDVYPLENVTLPPGLYQTAFTYRKALQPKEAFLLVKEGEAYLLAGRMKKTAFVGLNVAYEFFDAESEPQEESEELDFSML